MEHKLIFAPQALDTLEELVRHIARHNPAAAERFGNKLVDAVNILSRFPELGQPYRQRRDVRRLWCRPYFIYYRVRSDQRIVEIMEYWHSARQEPSF